MRAKRSATRAGRNPIIASHAQANNNDPESKSCSAIPPAVSGNLEAISS